MLEAKAAVRHGKWLPWLKEHCGLSERTAQRYMKLARRKAEITKSVTLSDLSITEALSLIEAADRINKLTEELLSNTKLMRKALAEFGCDKCAELDDRDWSLRLAEKLFAEDA